MKINFFKTKKNFKKKNLDLNSNFYWKIIVGTVFLLVLSSFVFGYYTFLGVKEDSISSGETFLKKRSIEKERLEKVLEYFSLREKKSVEILSSPTPIVDPSI
jgi:magnesium-transporting ATPase (P-type)